MDLYADMCKDCLTEIWRRCPNNTCKHLTESLLRFLFAIRKTMVWECKQIRRLIITLPAFKVYSGNRPHTFIVDETEDILHYNGYSLMEGTVLKRVVIPTTAKVINLTRIACLARLTLTLWTLVWPNELHLRLQFPIHESNYVKDA